MPCPVDARVLRVHAPPRQEGVAWLVDIDYRGPRGDRPKTLRFLTQDAAAALAAGDPLHTWEDQ